jgi:hypothetical protein
MICKLYKELKNKISEIRSDHYTVEKSLITIFSSL